MANPTVDATRDELVFFANLQSDRPVRAEIRVRPPEEPQPERQAHCASGEQNRVKRIIRKGEYRCHDPDEWEEKGYPSDSQEPNFQRSAPALRHGNRPAPLSMRRTDDDHHDAGQENDCLREPGVHTAANDESAGLETTLHLMSRYTRLTPVLRGPWIDQRTKSRSPSTAIVAV